MPPSTALARNQNRGRPALTAEEWEEADRAYEEAQRFYQAMYDTVLSGKLRLDNADTNCRVSKKNFEKPPTLTASVMFMLGLIDYLSGLDKRKQNWNNWAKLLLIIITNILDPEISIGILYSRFGRSILKKALNKQRGPTSAHSEDDERIRIYIDAIMWATGDSVRRACQQLARMGLKVRKDGAQGQSLVDLDNSETIRKRYINGNDPEYYNSDPGRRRYEMEMLRLKLMWHRSGEPPFLNWLKQTISRETPGPNTMRFSSQ